jgi:hypothetical protein
VGEDFAFTVEASGTPPLTFQWFFNGSTFAGQTNASLLLTNLTVAQSGFYSVSVQNVVTNVLSTNTLLTVQADVPRRLGTGRAVQSGSQVAVPITFRANGRESAVSFSLAYSNAFSNPTFLPANNTATVDVDLTNPGTVGVVVVLPTGQTFAPGDQWLGLMQFDLGPGSGPLQGGLAFSTDPIPITAVNSNGLALIISASVQPQFVVATTDATLRRQSGLFEQQLLVSNPGATVMSNIDLLAVNLGFDSRTNAIAFTNAQGVLTTFPFDDPLLQIGCDCACGFFLDAPGAPCDFGAYFICGTNQCSLDFTGRTPSFPFAQINNLAPGETRTVTVEFYVTDHFTVPHPQYAVFLADPFPLIAPLNATPLTITAMRFTNGTFLVEFPTTLGNHYYIQYAPSTVSLTNAQTVLPPVTGTGSRVQWIDNGPPKTDSPPTNGARFYQVLQSP